MSVQQYSDSGCITYIDHIVMDLGDWACGKSLGSVLLVEDGQYKITVYLSFPGGKNPPKTSIPKYMQLFEWSGYPEDVSVSENGCLHTG